MIKTIYDNINKKIKATLNDDLQFLNFSFWYLFICFLLAIAFVSWKAFQVTETDTRAISIIIMLITSILLSYRCYQLYSKLSHKKKEKLRIGNTMKVNKMTNKQRIKQVVKLYKAIDKTRGLEDDWAFCVHTTCLDNPKISVFHNDKWVKRDENNKLDIMAVYIDMNGKFLSADERLTQDQIDEAVEYGKEWLEQE